MNPVAEDVRELTPRDAPALREFFSQMPVEDRTFFFEDVSDPAVIDAWASDARRLRRCVADRGRIVALGALRPGADWTSHVADLLLLVAPDARRRGLGKRLARRMLIEALEHGFSKVSVMIATGNTGAIEMFQKLGFRPEALLRDQLRSPEDGSLHDTVILSHLVNENWATMLTSGFEDELR
jgi:ribosomal protein S18 acetylase RimI-like enzyme